MSRKGRKSRPKAARFQEFPMYNRRLMAGGAAFGLLVLVVVAFVLVAPRGVAGRLNALAQQQLGRSLAVNGGTHLDFSPLSVRLDDATLSGAAPEDDSLATVKSAVIPVTLGQLFGAAPEVASITLTEPEFALLINDRGEANWDFPGFTPGGPLRIQLEQARFRYFDTRNSQSMALTHVDGTLDMRADGGASFAGTTVINGRLVRIDADLKSLARINADGSPLEIALAADDGNASFSGRLSTAEVLSLAGPVSLSSQTPGPGLRLIGLPLPAGITATGAIAIDGALDSAGRAYAIRNATLSMGNFRAAGELGADLRNATPKLQARLVADRLWLDPFMPASGAKNGDWGRVPLPFALLKAFDIEATIDARSMSFGGFTAGGSELRIALTDGKLDVTSVSDLDTDGTLNVTVKADANAAPPSVAVNMIANDIAAQPLLGALTGATQLTGTGGFTANFTAGGTTQEELVGMLKGTASIDLVNGSIAGADLAGLVLAAKQKVLEGWQAAPGDTPFTSLRGETTIQDGIANFRNATIEGPVSFTLEGLIDVLRQGIAVSTTATTNGQPLLPVAVIARGPWGAPKIFADVPSFIANPDGSTAPLQDPASPQGN